MRGRRVRGNDALAVAYGPFQASLIELFSPATDWKRYRALLEEGVRAGEDQAAYALGSMYLAGSRTPKLRKDVARGIGLVTRASRSVPMAMVELASAYELGLYGLRIDPREAFRLFRRSVSYGSIVGRFHLGRCYRHGIGTRANARKARACFDEAASLGFRFDGEAAVYATPIAPAAR